MNTKPISRRSLLKIASASAAAALLMAACRPAAAPVAPVAQPVAPAAPAIPVVDLMLAEYAFTLPQKVPAGLITVNVMNHGKEIHFAAASRLSKEVSLDDIKKALDSPTPPDFIDQTQGFFAGIYTPGVLQQVTVKLAPGKYFVGCWVPSPDGQPHAVKGMMGIFEVVANTGEQPAEPVADLVITTKKDGVDFPKTISAGKHIWKVVNESGNSEAGGVNVVQLVSGKTLEDAKKSFEKADMSAIAGAYGGIGAPGSNAAWMTVDLKPGDYVLDTQLPDPKAPPPSQDQQPKTISIPFTVK